MFAILKMIWLVIAHKNNTGVLSSYRLKVNCRLKRLLYLFIGVQHQKRPSFSLRIKSFTVSQQLLLPCRLVRLKWYCRRVEGVTKGMYKTHHRSRWVPDDFVQTTELSSSKASYHNGNCATIYEITWELEAVTESQRHNDLKRWTEVHAT